MLNSIPGSPTILLNMLFFMAVTAVREAKAKHAVAFDEFDLPRFYEMTEQLEGI